MTNKARVSQTATLDPDLMNSGTIVRNGITYTRALNSRADTTWVDPRIIPEGMVYQWNRISVYNQPDVQNQVLNANTGWTPVPSDRHPGTFMPKDHKGDIVNGGLRLEERPIEWDVAARLKEKKEAQRQYTDSFREFGLEPDRPDYISTSTPAARGASFARRVNEQVDIPRSNANEIPIGD